MNDTQLERVLCYAQAGWFDSNIDPVTLDPAFMAAEADLAAMRQPITAEALLADGWTKRSPNTDYWWSKDGVSITNDKGAGGTGRWSFYTQDDRSGFTRAHPSNMHDLRELVRLLGKAK